MFRPFRKLLIKMRDYLRTLNKNELFQLEKLLCTNEEINLAQSLSNSQQQSNSTNVDESTAQCCDDSKKQIVIVQCTETKSNENFYSIKNGDDNSEWVSEENSEGRDEVDDEIDDDGSSGNYDEENLVTADCATGYLVPNTTLGNFQVIKRIILISNKKYFVGNLLQSNAAPLTYNIVISSQNGSEGEEEIESNPTENNSTNRDSGMSTGIDQSPEQETSSANVLVGQYDENWENLRKIVEPSSSNRNQNGSSSHRHHHHKERHGKHRKSRKLNQSSSSSDDTSSISSAASSPTTSTASTSSTGTIEVGLSSRDISRRAKFK